MPWRYWRTNTTSPASVRHRTAAQLGPCTTWNSSISWPLASLTRSWRISIQRRLRTTSDESTCQARSGGRMGRLIALVQLHRGFSFTGSQHGVAEKNGCQQLDIGATPFNDSTVTD